MAKPRKTSAGASPKYRKVPTQATLEGQAMANALRGMLADAGVNANVCAAAIDTAHSQIYDLLNGERNISPLLALKLATYLDTDPEALMLLQIRRDLAVAMAKHAKAIEAIRPAKGRAE